MGITSETAHSNIVPSAIHYSGELVELQFAFEISCCAEQTGSYDAPIYKLHAPFWFTAITKDSRGVT